MAYGKTKEGEEPKHDVGGILRHAINSMFGPKDKDGKPGNEGEKEESPEYHQRRTDEELKETNVDSMSRKGDQLSENVHTTEGNTPEQVTHPALKIAMAKLNEKDEDEPASKGGYVGMGSKV